MKLTSQLSWHDISYITLGKDWTTIKKLKTQGIDNMEFYFLFIW